MGDSAGIAGVSGKWGGMVEVKEEWMAGGEERRVMEEEEQLVVYRGI